MCGTKIELEEGRGTGVAAGVCTSAWMERIAWYGGTTGTSIGTGAGTVDRRITREGRGHTLGVDLSVRGLDSRKYLR